MQQSVRNLAQISDNLPVPENSYLIDVSGGWIIDHSAGLLKIWMEQPTFVDQRRKWHHF